MMNRITLPSGLVLDMSHLYGPDALITEQEAVDLRQFKGPWMGHDEPRKVANGCRPPFQRR